MHETFQIDNEHFSTGHESNMTQAVSISKFLLKRKKEQGTEGRMYTQHFEVTWSLLDPENRSHSAWE